MDSEPVFPDECWDLVSRGICLNCGEPISATERSTRGNHLRCHRQILRAIELGSITEEEAVTTGLFAPKAKAGAKPRTDTRLSRVLAAKERAESARLSRQSSSPDQIGENRDMIAEAERNAADVVRERKSASGKVSPAANRSSKRKASG